MNKEHFQLLLEDLYEKYNHAKKAEVPNIVAQYNGREFDAIKTFYFKYNFKTHAQYDARAGGDAYIIALIESYSKGERTIKNAKKEPSEEEKNIGILKKEIEQANSSLKDISETKKEELQKLSEKNIQAIENLIKEKEKYFENLIKKMDDIIEEKSKLVEEKLQQVGLESLKINSNDENVILKIELDFEESDIKLPKEVETMASGTRFLVPSTEGQLLAFEIKNIFCDYVTEPGKCIKEISIGRI